jgi:hypothetical protein
MMPLRKSRCHSQRPEAKLSNLKNRAPSRRDDPKQSLQFIKKAREIVLTEFLIQAD